MPFASVLRSSSRRIMRCGRVAWRCGACVRQLQQYAFLGQPGGQRVAKSFAPPPSRGTWAGQVPSW
eukprot:3918868-Lingulodinium_polyedra.AAC.1